MTSWGEVIYDDAKVMAALQRLHDKIGNIMPALLEIGEAMTESTKHRFETKVGTNGLWKMNSPVTAKAKGHWSQLIGGTAGPDGPDGELTRGQVTGDLWDSITYQMSGNFAVEIGSPMPQAAMMQFGGTKEEFPHLWGDIPARAYLGLSEEDERVVLRIIERHLNL